MKRNPFPQFRHSRAFAVLVLLVALPHSLGAQSQNPCAATTDPLAKLKCGNGRFLDDEHFKQVRDRAYRTGDQKPYAVILSCSDSRVPPELVFGEWGSLGTLFVIRTAGNVVDPVALGSIEYGVNNLGAKLILVLGHEKCGAVQAARAQAATPPNQLPPNIAWFVDPIKLAVERTQRGSEVDTIKENVRVQIQNLRRQSSIIRKLETEELRIAGGYYHISDEKKTGMVEFFSAPQ